MLVRLYITDNSAWSDVSCLDANIFSEVAESLISKKSESARRQSVGAYSALQKLLSGAIRSGKIKAQASSIKFFKDSRGRPHVGGIGTDDIDVSISHSGCLSLAALCLDGCKIGCDIELFDIKRDQEKLRRLAARYFDDDSLKELAKDSSVYSFYRIWTRLEATAKITGEGLSQLVAAKQTDTNICTKSYLVRHGNDEYLLTVCAEGKGELICELFGDNGISIHKLA